MNRQNVRFNTYHRIKSWLEGGKISLQIKKEAAELAFWLKKYYGEACNAGLQGNTCITFGQKISIAGFEPC